MDPLDSIFAADGLLARAVDGYQPRPAQLALAQAVDETIGQRGRLLAEAGTGTGKTWAYLVPALLRGGKTIVSTGTKTLQDQLFERDLPAVRAALGSSATIAVLKGRGNYICHHHLRRARDEGRFFSQEEAAWLPVIAHYARAGGTGDRAGLAEVPEDAPIWPRVTSTRDNCLGQACPNIRECFVLEARRRAQAADVVVVNHHLFFADVALKEDGAAELLPSAATVVFDEAHQLPAIAAQFFGESLSTGQAIQLAADAAGLAARGVCGAALSAQAQRLDRVARDLRQALGRDAGRLTGGQALAVPAVAALIAGLGRELAGVEGSLSGQGGAPEAATCAEQARSLRQRLERWQAAPADTHVRWLEVFAQTAVLHATPLSVAEPFGRLLDAQRAAWIFTSATLAVDGDFSHFQTQMGLDGARPLSLDSPFDYARQALLYVPEGLPEPNDPAFTTAVVDAAVPLLKASGGRAFMLFTSLRAMREAQRILPQRLQREGVAVPLLTQGEASRSHLLARFRELGNAVLLGSQSFWEGVDVRGEALSLVIIDKLPFVPPDDPVLAARVAALERAGRNAFMSYQLPHAALQLKQGAGRLIRDAADRGVLMLCDPRLYAKTYGRRILRCLPPMARTRRLDEAVAFFDSIDATNAEDGAPSGAASPEQEQT